MDKFNGSVDVYHASAGTGKTTQLLNIIEKYLSDGVPIERIAFVTFTRKGAEVAQLRIAERFGIPLNRLVNIRTIHSLCFRGCRASRDIMMDFDKYKEFGDKADFAVGGMSMNFAEGVDWNNVKDQQLVLVEQLYRNNRAYCDMIMEDRVDYGRLVEYIRLYKQYKNTFGYKDFTDLLEDYIKKDCCEDVDVACLDEMQDSSPLQWRVLFQAFHTAKHIHIVGDDKQAIYTFAGASPDILMNIRGEQHTLDISYRVPSKILSFADNIAREIQQQVSFSCRPARDGGEVIELTEIDMLDSYFNFKESYFFLCRNKKFYKYFIDWCIDNCVPYKIHNEPVFSDTDKIEFREGRISDWDDDKLDFAKRCYNKGVFYNTPNVNITTIHTVKGDEADNVVLMSDVSKAVACQFDIDEDSEHRVFYVAVTRAKNKLFIVQPTTKLFYPCVFQ